MPFDLHLMIFGDSTAAGYGCTSADEVPGVLIARGLAEQTGKRIRLSTKAIVGATSKGLSGQVDAMFVAGPPPDAAVIMVGANDITALNGISPSARRLGAAVRQVAAPAAPWWSSAPARTSASSPRSRSRCAGSRARGACGWPARRPRPSGRRRRAGAAGAICWHREFREAPDADVLRRRLPPLGGRVMRWRPSSCCSRCAMRWASGPAAAAPSPRCRRATVLGPSHARAACCRGCGGADRRRRCPVVVPPRRRPDVLRTVPATVRTSARCIATITKEPSCPKPSSFPLPARRSAAP